LNIHTIKHTINTKNLNSNKQKINKKLKVKLFKKIKETVLQILLNTKHFENVNLIFYKWVGKAWQDLATLMLGGKFI
jgi:hypothetical protein